MNDRIIIETEYKEGYIPTITEEEIKKILGMFKGEFLISLRKIVLCIPTYKGAPYKKTGDTIKIPQETPPFSNFIFDYTKYALGHELGHVIVDSKEGDEFVNKVWLTCIKERIPIDEEDVATLLSLVAMNKLNYKIPTKIAAEKVGRKKISIFERKFGYEIQKFFK